MKILLSSYPFAPSVGGIEEVSELVAGEFAALGHSVRVITMTPSAEPDRYPFTVVRRPNAAALLNSVRWCDVYLQMNISLKLAWPLVILRRPWIVAVHMPLTGARGRGWLAERIKRGALRFARVTAIAQVIAHDLGRRAMVVANPYRSGVFYASEPDARPHDLIFVGRLVSVKGADFLPDALAQLRDRGLTPSLLIVGSGPEESALREKCLSLGLDDQIEFAGVVRHTALAALLNRSKILVMPSRLEGFPVVALEGIACGCAVVASDANGLPEAVGPCGLVFPKGDTAALADRLAELLSDDSKRSALRAHARAHLARHQPRAVAQAYLSVIEETRAGRSRV